MSFPHPDPVIAAAASSTPEVVILMGTYQGAAFLEQQLASIAGQTLSGWCLVVSDDGSRDDTWDILETFQRHQAGERVWLRHGPGQGFASNFLALAREPGIKAVHYAFADQDDIWEPEKLARALAWLKSVPAGTPALYGTRTRLIDEAGREIGFSPTFSQPPCFANALVQSIAGGNTMVFNEAARQLLARYRDVPRAVSHDWWFYQAVTACGGAVHYDSTPMVRYRQHQGNLVGSNQGFYNGMNRLERLWKGQFRAWMDCNLDALTELRPRMTEPNRRLLDEFIRARSASSLRGRLAHGLRSGIHRQNWKGTLALRLALVLGKV